MRSLRYSLGWHLVCIGILGGTAARTLPAETATDTLRWVSESAEVHLSGTSSLRRWACSGTELDASMEVALDAARWEAAIAALLAGKSPDEPLPHPAIRARFEPRSLNYPSPRMKQDLLHAVRADKHPNVHYTATGVREVKRIDEGVVGALMYETEIEGMMTLAGVKRATTHAALVRVLDAHTIDVEGHISLNMYDFGIDPPVALLGLLRVHPDFTVAYRMRIRRADADPTGIARTATGEMEL